MASKHDLCNWLVDSLRARAGKASIVEVCKYVWKHHESELTRSGDFFYTWQYDIRWAAAELRKQGVLPPFDSSPKGIWELR